MALAHVMKPRAIVGIADVHPRAFAHRIEPFEDLDLIGAIFVGVGQIFWGVRHTEYIGPKRRKPKLRTCFSRGFLRGLSCRGGGRQFVRGSNPPVAVNTTTVNTTTPTPMPTQPSAETPWRSFCRGTSRPFKVICGCCCRVTPSRTGRTVGALLSSRNRGRTRSDCERRSLQSSTRGARSALLPALPRGTITPIWTRESRGSDGPPPIWVCAAAEVPIAKRAKPVANRCSAAILGSPISNPKGYV